MGKIIDLLQARASRRNASHSTNTNCLPNSNESPSSENVTVQPGVVILFQLLQRRRTIRLPDGTLYRLHQGALQTWNSDAWQSSQITVNALLSQVSGLSRMRWHQILNEGDPISGQDT